MCRKIGLRDRSTVISIVTNYFDLVYLRLDMKSSQTFVKKECHRRYISLTTVARPDKPRLPVDVNYWKGILFCSCYFFVVVVTRTVTKFS